jgi:hypothetical protein
MRIFHEFWIHPYLSYLVLETLQSIRELQPQMECKSLETKDSFKSQSNFGH